MAFTNFLRCRPTDVKSEVLFVYNFVYVYIFEKSGKIWI